MTTDPVPIRSLQRERQQVRDEILQRSTVVTTTNLESDKIKLELRTTETINQAIGTAYPDAIVPVFDTVPGTPSITATKPELISPAREDVIQSESALFSLDNAMFGGALTSVGEKTIQTVYDSSFAALGPIGNSLGGAAAAIVGTANAVTNTLTSTINSVTGAITDVLSGKILTDAVSGLMSTAEKFVAMVGEAAYQNVMGFLEAFKSVETILNSAATIASDIGQFVKKAGEDIAAVLNADWDKLSWPNINWNRIKSCFDTETFNKIGEGIGNFLGNVKLPIGLSVNQIKDLTKNLDLKEQLLKQVEDVKSGVTKIGTEALNSLYGQMAAVNNAILSITKLPSTLTSMFNGLVNRLDPLKERAANKIIMDYIKDGKVVKAGDEEEIDRTRAELRTLQVQGKAYVQGIDGVRDFPSPQSLNSWSLSDINTYADALPPKERTAFEEYARQNQDAINADGARERRRADRLSRP